MGLRGSAVPQRAGAHKPKSVAHTEQGRGGGALQEHNLRTPQCIVFSRTVKESLRAGQHAGMHEPGAAAQHREEEIRRRGRPAGARLARTPSQCPVGFLHRPYYLKTLTTPENPRSTPEYMSPELLRNTESGKNGGGGGLQEYDPRSVDVWAAGVMLVVALCGAFPFDHTRAHEGFTDDQELDLWCAQPPFVRGSLYLRPRLISMLPVYRSAALP